jgi:hypothetical protein
MTMTAPHIDLEALAPLVDERTGIRFGVVEVTPEIAGALLAMNRPRQRAIKDKVVAKYRHDMRDANWLLSGESIIVDEDRELTNGQHRLEAVVLEKATCLMTIVVGVPRDAWSVLDQGTPRLLADVLNGRTTPSGAPVFLNRAHAVLSASALREFVDALARRHRLGSRSTISELEALFDLYPDVQDAAVAINGIPRKSLGLSGLHPSEATFVMWRLRRVDRAAAHDFVVGVLTGEALDATDVRFKLREILQADAKRRSEHFIPRERVAITLAAWNKWRGADGTALTRKDARFEWWEKAVADEATLIPELTR